jgi:hypothetical protein
MPSLSPRPEVPPVRSRLIGLVMTASALVVLAGAPGAPAASPKSCELGSSEQRSFGPTYVTALRVTGTACGSGKTLVRAFHKCRKANGGVKGRCKKTVRGYECAEKRGGIATQFSGKVTCTKGKVTVVHAYTQFT